MRTSLYAVLSFFLIYSLAVRGLAAPINVNTADAAAIADALSGIGPRIGAAIVEYREANGPFSSVDDLLNVKGVGPKILEKNRADILLDNEPGNPAESEPE